MTKFEIVVPVEWGESVFMDICTVMEKNSSEWAWARHIPDELCNREHWHVGATLPSNRQVVDIHKWFTGIPNVLENSIEKIDSHWKTYLCYIQHKTKKAIEQGKTPPTEFGGSADFEKALGDYKTIGECDTLIDDILHGKVREYEFYSRTDLVSAILKKGWYLKVKNAFDAYTKDSLTRSSSRTEERKQCWIFGKAGSGKTEVAKWLCRSTGYKDTDIYITSSGSNPFDDYKGQPCVIVDDIDAETMSPKTMLKLADCFTGSAVKARYSNKVILADLVVFTSTIAPQNWWQKLAQEKVDGNVFQLLRRLNLGSWHIDGNTISATFYDGKGNSVAETVMDMPSEVMEKITNPLAQVDKALDFLSARFTIRSTDTKGHSVTVKSDISMEFKPPFVDDGQ